MRGPASVLVLAAAALAGDGCGGEEEAGAPSGEPLRTVEVTATEFAFEPARVELDRAGTYSFSLRNDGSFEHALEIEGGDVEVESDTVGGGETAELTVELPAGTYELYCPVGNHREEGMEGTLTVGGAAGGGAPTGEDDEDEDDRGSGYGYD